MRVYFIKDKNLFFREESNDYKLLNNETTEKYKFDMIFPDIKNNAWIETAKPDEIEAHQRSLIPQTASKQRFKLALLKLHGITNSQVLSVIEQIPDAYKREAIKILWLDSDFYERADENLNSLAKGVFKLTDEQIDELFIESNK
jgi:hypothetical protein